MRQLPSVFYYMTKAKKGNIGDRAKDYQEIRRLYYFLEKAGFDVELEDMFDGFALRFRRSRADIIQHSSSYGGPDGFLEPAIMDDDCDFKQMRLQDLFFICCAKYDILNK